MPLSTFLSSGWRGQSCREQAMSHGTLFRELGQSIRESARQRYPPTGIVYVVDDEPAVRRALCRLLRAASFDVCGFGSAEEFLTCADGARGPACLIADLSLPGIGGLELQELMRERGLDLPIVFISGHADVRSGVQAMRGGAVDFLEKPLSMLQLVPALQSALARDQGRRADAADHADLKARADRLTSREREVFTLVVTGLANKCVAAELGASEKTIKVHRARVMEKMGARSFADLVRMADKLAAT
jgi:FixJ family two-component response regulator